VGLVFRLVELLILILPLVGMFYAGFRAFSSFTRRLGEAPSGSGAEEAAPNKLKTGSEAWRAIRRAVDAHEQTDARWLQYELDAAKLLDFPVMTDMRDPLTTGFHKAKLRAEFHKPVRAEDLLGDPDAARQYLDAVESYVTAFNAAEAEATRRRRRDFSREEQQRLARAQSLLRVASDDAATPQERARAYDLARNELDGLIVLPGNTRASLERGIAGEIDG
jgi:hypothetical protein